MNKYRTQVIVTVEVLKAILAITILATCGAIALVASSFSVKKRAQNTASIGITQENNYLPYRIELYLNCVEYTDNPIAEAYLWLHSDSSGHTQLIDVKYTIECFIESVKEKLNARSIACIAKQCNRDC